MKTKPTPTDIKTVQAILGVMACLGERAEAEFPQYVEQWRASSRKRIRDRSRGRVPPSYCG